MFGQSHLFSAFSSADQSSVLVVRLHGRPISQQIPVQQLKTSRIFELRLERRGVTPSIFRPRKKSFTATSELMASENRCFTLLPKRLDGRRQNGRDTANEK